MSRKFSLIAGAVLLGLGLGARPAEAVNMLRTDPGNIRVELKGPLSISGITPMDLADLPAGKYRVSLDGRGIPSVHGSLTRSANGQLSLSTDAGLNTLLHPPGIAFLRRGERGRGWVYLASGLGFATGGLVKEFSLRDREDDLDRAQRLYDDAVGEATLSDARRNLDLAFQEAEDEKELRNLWAFFAGATWVGSAIEASILTPGPDMRTNSNRDYLLSAGGANPVGAAFRSALIPGAGQRYMGRDKRGNRFTAAFSTMAAVSLVIHDAYLEKRRDQLAVQSLYDAADTEGEIEARRRELEEAADDAERLDRWRWGVVGVTGAIYIWNIFDAVRLVGTDSSPGGLTWQMSPNPDGFRAGLVWRID